MMFRTEISKHSHNTEKKNMKRSVDRHKHIPMDQTMHQQEWWLAPVRYGHSLPWWHYAKDDYTDPYKKNKLSFIVMWKNNSLYSVFGCVC